MKSRILCLSLVLAWSLQAGKLVVNNDEWDLSNIGYSSTGGSGGSTATFALNIADYFTGGGPGNFLVYSDNFGLVQSDLSNTMTGAGHTWTVNNSLTFTAANLAAYDGVFLAGFEGGYSTTEAAAYINAGGNIYIAAGTSDGLDQVTEANFWNPLLFQFGLQLAPVYNNIGGNIAINSAHPLLSGVSQLYQNNGNSVSPFGANPNASIILSTATSAQGLIGVSSSGDPQEVPEPGTYALLASGLGVLFLRRRSG